jgi:hypothetical protein
MVAANSSLQADREPNHTALPIRQQFANRRHSRLNVFSAFAIGGVLLTGSSAFAQQFEIKPIAEKKISELPAGPLYWRVENFPTLAQAQAAASPTALVAEAAGKNWLFTLGPKGDSSSHAIKVAEIGPVPTFAPEYLLRVNIAGGHRKVQMRNEAAVPCATLLLSAGSFALPSFALPSRGRRTNATPRISGSV